MARRIGLLAIAVVLSLFGAISLVAYARGSDARAAEGQSTVSVFVANKEIAAGTAVGSIGGAVQRRALPGTAVPAGAVTDLKTLTDQVTARDLHAGEVLLPTQFVGKQIAGSLKIPAGKLAMSVQLQDPERVAGFVLPGSQVAVFVTYSKGTSATDLVTRMLLSKVQVIAVGPTALSTVGGSGAEKDVRAGGLGSGNTQDPTALLTVAVDSDQALKLVQATQTGKLYFALLSDSSRTGDGSRAVDNSSLFN